MRSLLILSALCCILLTGCGLERAASQIKPPADSPAAGVLPDLEPPKPGKDGKVPPLEQAKHDYLLLSEKAKQAAARYEVMRQIAYDDALRAQVMWITGIALIVAALATIAAVVSPVGKKTFVGVAVACGIIAACAQAFRESVPYLPWIGGVLIIVAGIWAAFNWKKLATTVKTAADHGDRLEDWLVNDVMPKLDDTARGIMEATIAEAKEESKKQAMLLGTHTELQYLRGKAKGLFSRIFGKD